MYVAVKVLSPSLPDIAEFAIEDPAIVTVGFWTPSSAIIVKVITSPTLERAGSALFEYISILVSSGISRSKIVSLPEERLVSLVPEFPAMSAKSI